MEAYFFNHYEHSNLEGCGDRYHSTEGKEKQAWRGRAGGKEDTRVTDWVNKTLYERISHLLCLRNQKQILITSYNFV